jgi:SAM-dependent methyltransferase
MKGFVVNGLWVLGLCATLGCNRSNGSPVVQTEPLETEPAASASAEQAEPEQPPTVEEPEDVAASGVGDPTGARIPDVVFVPTPQPVVDKMLELAQVKRTDVVYDLGCGDGRIVITAAKKYKVKAYGFDIDPVRVAEARANVAAAGLEDLVTIEEKDIFTLDLSPANVVTLYLLPELNVRLIPQLQKLRPGSRVVSHDFDMEGVKPLKHLTMNLDTEHEVYLWRTPLRMEPAGK